MKYRIYIDEVGNPDLKSSIKEDHRFLCLTGVIFDLQYVGDVVQSELEKFKSAIAKYLCHGRSFSAASSRHYD